MLHVSSHQEKCFIMFSEFINGIAFFFYHTISTQIQNGFLKFLKILQILNPNPRWIQNNPNNHYLNLRLKSSWLKKLERAGVLDKHVYKRVGTSCNNPSPLEATKLKKNWLLVYLFVRLLINKS